MTYSPWGCKDLDTTERLHFHKSRGHERGQEAGTGKMYRLPLDSEPDGDATELHLHSK